MLPCRMPGHEPTFDLTDLIRLIEGGHYIIKRSARNGAASLYLDEDDMVECVAGLTDLDFYKTMESTKRPGTFQDVYKRRYHSFPIYLKLQLAGSRCVVISFKRDESA